MNTSVNIIGTSGIIAVPLLDVETGLPPHAIIGPGNKIHNQRLAARMPSQSEMDGVRPPAGYDPRDPMFDIEGIVIFSEPPRNVTVDIYEIKNGAARAKYSRKNLSNYPSIPKLGNRRFIEVHLPVIACSELVTVLARTKFHRGRRIESRMAPRAEIRSNWSPVLRVKVTWNRIAQTQRSRVVKGDPFIKGGGSVGQPLPEWATSSSK